MKHTPGPWKVAKGMAIETADGKVAVGSAGPRACGPYFVTECEANAALIAAAPELLQALKNIIQSAPLVGLPLALEKDIQSATYVIARAEGKT